MHTCRFLYLRWCQSFSASKRRVAGSDAISHRSIAGFTLDAPLHHHHHSTTTTIIIIMDRLVPPFRWALSLDRWELPRPHRVVASQAHLPSFLPSHGRMNSFDAEGLIEQYDHTYLFHL
jgi:hypothetical protein